MMQSDGVALLYVSAAHTNILQLFVFTTQYPAIIVFAPNMSCSFYLFLAFDIADGIANGNYISTSHFS